MATVDFICIIKLLQCKLGRALPVLRRRKAEDYRKLKHCKCESRQESVKYFVPNLQTNAHSFQLHSLKSKFEHCMYLLIIVYSLFLICYLKEIPLSIPLRIKIILNDFRTMLKIRFYDNLTVIIAKKFRFTQGSKFGKCLSLINVFRTMLN